VAAVLHQEQPGRHGESLALCYVSALIFLLLIPLVFLTRHTKAGEGARTPRQGRIRQYDFCPPFRRRLAGTS